MNEEFSDYEVLVAKSTDGGEITQDISWKVEASKDIVVWCDIAGLMVEGTFDYNGNSIIIHGYDRPFTAYIMRKECAEYVISKNANGTFSVDTILEQLKKNVRILEQLEETDTRTLQCVDAVKPITDKDNRIGKVLSFDDNGNPVCEVEVDDVEKIKAYKDEAQASATKAEDWAEKAEEAKDNALGMLSQTQTLVDGFGVTVEEKQSEVIDAIDSKQSEVIDAIDSSFSTKLSEKTEEFDEYTSGTISEIEGIKHQAQTSATSASESATSAQASATSASTILSQTQKLVDGFDTEVENKQSEVIDVIDSHFSDKTIEFDEYADSTIGEIEGIKNQAQALVDNALEIVDPEGFRQDTSTNITDLQMFKANTGALHFNGGNAQCSGLANKPIPNINTIAFRWKCDAVTFENIPVSQRVVGYVGSWYHLARIKGGLQFYVKYVDGQQYIGLTESNIITLLTDGNWHNVAIISTGTTFDFAIDGKILKSVARSNTTGFAIPTSNFIVSYSTTNIGSIADVFIFNFDITSEDALYTIADYQQGKPIPPSLLLGGGNRFNIVGAVQGTDYKVSGFNCTGSFIEENGVYTIGKGTITEGQTNIQSYLLLKLSSTIKAGSKVKINLKRSGTDSIYLIRLTAEALKVQTTSATAPDYLTISGSSWSGDDLVNNTLVTTIDCNGIYLQLGNSYETFSFTEFTIEVNGVVLALEDYTIANGNSKFVFDYSGNNNDATITGNVNGDNDSRVQKLIDFIKS